MDKPGVGGTVLCQPDNMKGCSVCCGLFNFRNLSRHFLSGFLEEGDNRERELETFESFPAPSDIRDRFSHICPYQGFLDANRPGCLIHPLYSGCDGRGRSLFAGKICGEFFCPAHYILSEEEKLFLVEKVSDWYLYSVAISDPESYSYIYNYVKNNFSEECKVKTAQMINEGLAAHACNLASYNGVIFYYSVPEYNMNKINFCIRYKNETGDLVISRIKNYIFTVDASQS